MKSRAAKPGFVIQRRPLVTTHGGFRDRITFLMVKAEPAIIRGKVTKLDGTTPVVGATVTATSNDPNNPLTLTGVTDINGNYVIDRVPAGTTYILTVTGFPAGFAHRACRNLIRCRIRTIPSQGSATLLYSLPRTIRGST